MEDYAEGKIPYSFISSTKKYKNPFIDSDIDTVIGLSNWFSYAYMTWNGKTKTLIYGRNKNYEYEMKTFDKDI